MAYTRWSTGELYMIWDVSGYIRCISCPFTAMPLFQRANQDAFNQDWRTPSTQDDGPKMFDEAIAHLEKHKTEGHKFSDTAILSLRIDRDDHVRGKTEDKG